jgi:hypothetical protein
MRTIRAFSFLSYVISDEGEGLESDAMELASAIVHTTTCVSRRTDVYRRRLKNRVDRFAMTLDMKIMQRWNVIVWYSMSRYEYTAELYSGLEEADTDADLQPLSSLFSPAEGKR